MADWLNRYSVLRLNRAWQVLGVTTPKDAIIALCSNRDGAPPAKVLDVIYHRNDDGSYDLTTTPDIIPLDFDQWPTVSIREGLDHVIHSSRMAIRSPTVIVTNYDKMPMRKLRPTKSVLLEMQKGICGYTNRPLSPKQANIEHKLPRSKGGRDTFENLMVVDKKVNCERGNMPLEQFKYKPLFNHKEPKPMPVAYTIKTVAHPDWKWFIYDKDV
jgi:5-methylcytosine-specific restriction endonuclease McrA